MSKRPATKERGEPPSYFQSMLNSKYTRQRPDISPVVIRSSDDSSNGNAIYASNAQFAFSLILIKRISFADEEAMCDDVVNEHFRRSLGEDYVNVFSSNKKHDNQIVDSQTSAEEVEHDDRNERSTEGLSGELQTLWVISTTSLYKLESNLVRVCSDETKFKNMACLNDE